MSVEFEEINKQREANDENLVMVDFTDEEGYGKYLDLHECYNKYLNIKGRWQVYVPTLDVSLAIKVERCVKRSGEKSAGCNLTC